MPESLLNELEVTAEKCGIRVALLAAHDDGYALGLNEAFAVAANGSALKEPQLIQQGVQMSQPAKQGIWMDGITGVTPSFEMHLEREARCYEPERD